MNNNSETLAKQILVIINKLIFLERKNVFPYRNLKLYPSEIHLMLLIGDEQGNNVTKMAGKLGVTKGAVSQTLSRLEKKGILEKTKDPFNKNELMVTFTPIGEDALDKYREMRMAFFNHFANYFSSLSETECEVVELFLSHMEVILNDMLE